MEDAKTIKSIIELNDYMVSIDLAEAFFFYSITPR